jgi:hypothetical protein
MCGAPRAVTSQWALSRRATKARMQTTMEWKICFCLWPKAFAAARKLQRAPPVRPRSLNARLRQELSAKRTQHHIPRGRLRQQEALHCGDFTPTYVGLGVKSVGSTRPTRSRHVRYASDSDRIGDARLSVALCRYCCKSPKLPGANFSAVKNPTDDRRSMWPQSRYRGRQRVYLQAMRSPTSLHEIRVYSQKKF